MINEPHPGYIALPSLHAWNYQTELHLGAAPSPLQSFAAGDGHATPDVAVYTRSWPVPTRRTGSMVLPLEESARAWLDGVQCAWEREAVWMWDREQRRAVVLKEGYFSRAAEGRRVDFYADFYWPFVRRWEGMVQSLARGKMMHVEGVPNEVRWLVQDVRLANGTSVLSRLAARRSAEGSGLLAALVCRMVPLAPPAS